MNLYLPTAREIALEAQCREMSAEIKRLQGMVGAGAVGPDYLPDGGGPPLSMKVNFTDKIFEPVAIASHRIDIGGHTVIETHVHDPDNKEHREFFASRVHIERGVMVDRDTTSRMLTHACEQLITSIARAWYPPN